MGDLEETTDQGYHEYWLSLFPCPCGHPPERHFLAPMNGICRSCMDCHGEFGGILRYASAIQEVVNREAMPHGSHIQ